MTIKTSWSSTAISSIALALLLMSVQAVAQPPASASKSPSVGTEERARLLALTSEEQQAADRDAAVMAAARQANQANGGNRGGGLKGILTDAIEVPELEAASSLGRTYRVKLALQRGDHVNAKGVMFGSALHAAAENGHIEVVKLLLACGAERTVRDAQGKTAADVAKTPAIAALLKPGDRAASTAR